MRPSHTETAYMDGAINIVESENNNYVAKVNVVHARKMFLDLFINDEQAQEESVNLNSSDGAYYMSEDRLLESIKIPISECADILSAATEQLMKDTSNDCGTDVRKFDNENSVPVINEQYISADLSGFMKMSFSDYELDNNSEQLPEMYQSVLSLQCLKCNEKFHHRFWAIRHVDFCQSSDDKSDPSLKSPVFQCGICETEFKRFSQLTIHLQICAKDSASQHSEKEPPKSEDMSGFKNYLSIASKALKVTMEKFGHQRLYAHFCPNCLESITDEASVNPVECNKCKATSLLQCQECKCLHETHESIIDHLESSFCGYQLQCYYDHSSFEASKLTEPQISKLLTDAQRRDKLENLMQKKKSNKNQKNIKTSEFEKTCPRCFISKKTTEQRVTHCLACSSRMEFRCDKCDARAVSFRALERHKKSHCENYMMCPKCGRLFGRMKNLKMHKKICAQSQTTIDDLIPKEREQISITAQ